MTEGQASIAGATRMCASKGRGPPCCRRFFSSIGTMRRARICLRRTGSPLSGAMSGPSWPRMEAMPQSAADPDLRPDSEWRAIRQLYFAMIVSAQRRVLLQSPFFILDATVAEALKAAALSGVEVDVMVSDRGEGLNQAPYWAANTYLAESRPRACGFISTRRAICTRRRSASTGRFAPSARPTSTPQLQHQLRTQCRDLRRGPRAELEAAFEKDRRDCRPFDLQEYRRVSVLRRLRDSVARLLSPLL